MCPENRERQERPDVVAELKRLGRQMGETLEVAWNSVERRRAEEDLRAGARAFAEEFGRALRKARTARPDGVASKARESTVDGLRWMSDELATLADRFTPKAEREPESPATREEDRPE